LTNTNQLRAEFNLDNKQIDREFRNEELKEKYLKPAIVVAVIALGLLILFISTPQPVEHQRELLSGKTLYEIPASEGYGYDSAMIVQLENGQEVRVPKMDATVFKKDSSVEIDKVTSAGGTVSYEFSRYKN